MANIIINDNNAHIQWVEGQWKICHQDRTYAIFLTDKDSTATPMQYCDQNSSAYQRQKIIAEAALAAFKKALQANEALILSANFEKLTVSNTDKKMSIFSKAQPGQQAPPAPTEILYTALDPELKEKFSSAFKGALLCRFERPAALPKLEGNKGSLAAVVQATRVLKFYRHTPPQAPGGVPAIAQRHESLHRVYQDLEGSEAKVPKGHLQGDAEGPIQPLLSTIPEDKRNSPSTILTAISEGNLPLQWEARKIGETESNGSKSTTTLSLEVRQIPRGRSLQAHLQKHLEPGAPDGTIWKWKKQPPVLTVELKRDAKKSEHHVPIDQTLDLKDRFFPPPDGQDPLDADCCKYKLKSFIAAKNPVQGPHIAYVKEGNQWFKCEETFVIRITDSVAEEALKQAHLCFYEPLKLDDRPAQ